MTLSNIACGAVPTKDTLTFLQIIFRRTKSKLHPAFLGLNSRKFGSHAALEVKSHIGSNAPKTIAYESFKESVASEKKDTNKI